MRYALLAECPACEENGEFQVFTPVEIYLTDRSIADPPLERWRCAECQVTLQAWALGSVVDLVPKR